MNSKEEMRFEKQNDVESENLEICRVMAYV
jgi:hypothetical protein